MEELGQRVDDQNFNRFSARNTGLLIDKVG